MPQARTVMVDGVLSGDDGGGTGGGGGGGQPGPVSPCTACDYYCFCPYPWCCITYNCRYLPC